jgi:hypothetical protein
MKVDETGAELVSYGAIGGVLGGICGNCPPPPFHMIVNRPFFFWIVDTRTNCLGETLPLHQQCGCE